MTEVYREVAWADVIVFASPMYFGGITGTLKTATDRFYSFWMKNNWSFQKECALMISANSYERGQILEWYKVYAEYSGWKSRGTVFSLGNEKTEDANTLGASIC